MKAFSWEACGQTIMHQLDHLARYSETEEGLTRTYLTPAHHAAAQQLAEWMQAAGMTVRRDAVGNVIGRYEGSQAGAPALLTGSHFDTVRQAGKYDGNLGIVLPIACVARWHAQGRRFPFAIEIIGFAEEEGVRFQATLLGSRALAGTFDLHTLERQDAQGVTLRRAIDQAGLGFSHCDLSQAAYARVAVLGFIEVHIEQGPVLLQANLPLGVVTAISGASRFQVTLTGQAGHAGTVPMALRRDAAMAAAEIGLYIEQRCQQDSSATGLVGTVGQLSVPDGAVNVIPGRAHLSIDIRAGEDAQRQAAVTDVIAAIASICTRRQVQADIVQTHAAASVPCATGLQQQLAAALQRCRQPVYFLPSGAGHDAMAMASLTDVAMLFVRCGNGGISHHPDESLQVEDAARAAQVLSDYIEHFSPSYSG